MPCNDDEAICDEHTTIASIVVLKGYFRFDRSDPTIYPCPRDKLCLESMNSTTSSAYRCRCVLHPDMSISTQLLMCNRNASVCVCVCSEGSKGPACAICEEHWYFSLASAVCERCDDASWNLTRDRYFWGLVIIGVLIVIILLLRSPLLKQVLPPFYVNLKRNLAHKFCELWDASLVAQGKVCWTGYQILGSTSWSLDYVPFPAVVDTLTSNLNSITLFNFAVGVPAACIDPSINEYRRLFFQTLGPPAVTLLLFVGFLFRGTRDPSLRDHHWRQFAYAVTLLAYVLLPSTSGALFNVGISHPYP